MAKAKQKNGQSPEHVAAIRVAGFKSIATEQRIELRPLTILAGANSSGKSSIMQALLLLKQSMEAPYGRDSLWLAGPNVSVGSPDSVLSRLGSEKHVDRFTVTFEGSPGWAFELAFIEDQERGFAIEWTLEDDQRWGGRVGPVRQVMTHDEIEAVLTDDLKQFAKEISDNAGRPADWQVFEDPGMSFGASLRLRVLGSSTELASTDRHLVPPVVPCVAVFLGYLLHVPAHRMNPTNAYPAAATSPGFSGRFDHYVPGIIHGWQKTNDERHREVERVMETLGLTGRIEADEVANRTVSLRVGRLPPSVGGGHEDLVSLADVGFGVSQALPVIVALLAAEPEDTVYIEEPEIHLHPRAVYRMARVLADAAARGVRIVVETHSSLLLVGLQTLVANGDLAPDLVKLYWFVRNERDGATTVKEGELDENGAYGDWPADFGDVELDADGGYLDAVEARSARA